MRTSTLFSPELDEDEELLDEVQTGPEVLVTDDHSIGLPSVEDDHSIGPEDEVDDHSTGPEVEVDDHSDEEVTTGSETW